MITFRVEPELAATIRAEAARENRSTSNYLQLLIRDELARTA